MRGLRSTFFFRRRGSGHGPRTRRSAAANDSNKFLDEFGRLVGEPADRDLRLVGIQNRNSDNVLAGVQPSDRMWQSQRTDAGCDQSYGILRTVNARQGNHAIDFGNFGNTERIARRERRVSQHHENGNLAIEPDDAQTLAVHRKSHKAHRCAPRAEHVCAIRLGDGHDLERNIRMPLGPPGGPLANGHTWREGDAQRGRVMAHIRTSWLGGRLCGHEAKATLSG
jgi:hypothetical protein